MPVYVLWFGVALAMLVLELVSTTFFAIFLAVVAMAGVVVGRPLLARRLRRRGEAPLTPGVHGGFVGQRVLALDTLGDELHPGHVREAHDDVLELVILARAASG